MFLVEASWLILVLVLLFNSPHCTELLHVRPVPRSKCTTGTLVSGGISFTGLFAGVL